MPDTRDSLTDTFQDLQRGPVDTRLYCSDDVYKQEKEKIFRTCWMMAGRVEQIPNKGDYFVREVPTFGQSLIFVRGADGQVRGFHNACPHRGNHVCLEEQGNVKLLRCKFHNWAFNLEGAAVAIPDIENFFDLEKEDVGLTPVTTEIWNGFIFFNLSDTPEQTLQDYLGDIGESLTGYPFEDGTTRFQISATLGANWKSVIDSFCETYHLPALHRHSIAQTLAGGNKFGHLVNALECGPHRAASVWGNKDYVPKPVQAIAYKFAAGEAITSGQGARADLPRGVNPSRSDNWGLDINIIFPNLAIVIGAGSYFCHQVWPVTAGETVWEMTGFWAPAQTAADRFVQEYFLAELRDVASEDLNTLERAQSNIASGAIKTFHFHDHEVLLRHHYTTILKYLGMEDFQDSPA